MTSEVAVALISSFVVFFGAIMTLVIGLKTVRTERERLTIERERLQAEISKLSVETEKLKSEMDDARRRKLEEEYIMLEIEKQKVASLTEKRNIVYPKLLELVYRIRNQFRERIERIDYLEGKTDIFAGSGVDIDNVVYLLTESLYQHRAIIDQETFTLLHDFKRLAQDARVYLNRATRPVENGEEALELIDKGEFDSEIVQQAIEMEKSQMLEISEELRDIYLRMERIFPSLTKCIQNHFEVSVPQKE